MTIILDAIPPAGPGEPWIVPAGSVAHRRIDDQLFTAAMRWIDDQLFAAAALGSPPAWAVAPLSPEDVAAVRRAGGL